MEFLIPKIILNKLGILIPSNSNMTNFLGIPNLLIKIEVNNSQNKMTIKIDLRKFSNSQFLKHVHKIKIASKEFSFP